MQTLPNQRRTADDDASQPPNRPLDSVVLPGNLGAQVRELLGEWAESEKLLRYGMTPRNRVLLYGPPGNGKTTLAAAVATELNLPLHQIDYSDLIEGRLGDTNHHISAAFRRAQQPCVLFFDECDALLGTRSQNSDSCSKAKNSFVNTALVELDRLPTQSVVIFATNFDQVLDPAMRRRVHLQLEMPAPSVADLRRLLTSLQSRHPLWPLDDFDVDGCGATSFAACELLATDHARRKILAPGFDPLGLAGKPRSAWLREQVAAAGGQAKPGPLHVHRHQFS